MRNTSPSSSDSSAQAPSAGDDTASALPEDSSGDDDPLQRVALDRPNASKGLAQLVLTLIKLLHDLLEKQAIRRMESGALTDEEVERVGRTLKKQLEEIEHICDVFGLDLDDLDLDLGTIEH